MLISILKFVIAVIVIVVVAVFAYQYTTGQSLLDVIDSALTDDTSTATTPENFDPNVLSEEIAKEIPIFPNSAFVQSIEIFDGHSAFFSIDDVQDTAEIEAYYNKEMANRGWDKGTGASQGPMIGLTFSKGDKSISFAIGTVLYGRRGFVVNLVNR